MREDGALDVLQPVVAEVDRVQLEQLGERALGDVRHQVVAHVQDLVGRGGEGRQRAIIRCIDLQAAFSISHSNLCQVYRLTYEFNDYICILNILNPPPKWEMLSRRGFFGHVWEHIIEPTNRLKTWTSYLNLQFKT